MLRPSVEEGLDTRFMAGKHCAFSLCSLSLRYLLLMEVDRWSSLRPGSGCCNGLLAHGQPAPLASVWRPHRARIPHLEHALLHHLRAPLLRACELLVDLWARLARDLPARHIAPHREPPLPMGRGDNAQHRRTGVTCGDLIDQLGEFLNAHVEASAFEVCPESA